MARTFVDQSTQVFHSDVYNDQFASGVSLVSSSADLQDDLNALRTQVRELLWSADPGNWYDGVEGVPNLSFARGVNGLNSSLTTVEQQRFIYDVQSLAFVQVPSGSNFVSLSVSGSTSPMGLAAVGLGAVPGNFTGSIVASLSGLAGVAHSLALVSGTSAITPRNLVGVRDAFTHLAFTDPTHGNHEVFGLLQIDNAAADGQAFSDTAPGQTQISFVVEFPSGTFVAADVGTIGGKIINYQYRARTNYLGLPEDAYTNTVFVDVTPIASGFAALSDITLQEAINNQGNTVVSDPFATAINLAAAGSWRFFNGSTTLLALNATGDVVFVSGTYFGVGSGAAQFGSGISVATGSANQLDIFTNPGVIESVNGMFLEAGGNLGLTAGLNLQFNDQFGALVGSGSINFASSQAQWNNFYTSFGASATILGALDALTSSISSSITRVRESAGTSVGINAGTNVTFGTNLDAPLPSYAGKDFVKDVNVFLNGILLVPDLSGNNDVFPGTNPATGDLKFTMPLRSGSVVSLEVF